MEVLTRHHYRKIPDLYCESASCLRSVHTLTHSMGNKYEYVETCVQPKVYGVRLTETRCDCPQDGSAEMELCKSEEKMVELYFM